MTVGIAMVRPNPGILEGVIRESGARTPAAIAGLLVSAVANKPLLDADAPRGAGELGSGEAAWGKSHAGTAKSVFRGGDAALIPGYLVERKRQFLTAFRGGEGVVSATRWAICARLLADLGAGLDPKGGMGPFVGLPYVEVMGFLSSPRCFAGGVAHILPTVEGKPAWVLEQSPSFRSWGRTRTGLENVLNDTCQVRDLLPEKDRDLLLDGEAEQLLVRVEAERLHELLCALVGRHPVPPSLEMRELERAVGDFLLPEGGMVPVSKVKSQVLWNRGLMESPASYKPCQVCGFPVFFAGKLGSVSAKPDFGWLVGGITGNGWRPGDAEGTVPVPVCYCCQAEKILVEDGTHRFGKTPVMLFNRGERTIPGALLEEVWRDTNERSGGPKDLRGCTQVDLSAGDAIRFTDVSDRLMEAKSTPSMAYLRKKLSYAYLRLSQEGYKVAFAFGTEPHPCGIFGWVPKVEPAEASQRITELRVHLQISHLPFRGYSRRSEDYAALAKRERAILMGDYTSAILALADAMRSMELNPYLAKAIQNIFDINGGAPMRFANLDLMEEAAFWAEAAYPYLADKREIWQSGGSTKAFSEAINNMQRAAPGGRVGAAMAGVTRNISEYLGGEQAKEVAPLLEEMQKRFERYAELNNAELQAFRNSLDPMIRAAVTFGAKYRPDQNNWCKLTKRRLNDPEPASTPASPFANA